jgi:hypothetical protein
MVRISSRQPSWLYPMERSITEGWWQPVQVASTRSRRFPMARLELYFGTQRPGGAPVTEAEWGAFLNEEVTPRFPDGLTVLTGNGQWRNSAGVITRETSALLIVLYEPSVEKEAAIEDIRAAYKDRFDQESVMRVDAGLQCVSF